MDRRKRLALVAAIMGSFVAGLDATAVNDGSRRCVCDASCH
jgi:hypothetical protein